MRTIHRAFSPVLFTALIGLATACSPPAWQVWNDYVEPLEVPCHPDIVTTIGSPTSRAELGRAVASVYSGDITDPRHRHEIFVGAPKDGGTGLVARHAVFSDGSLGPRIDVLFSGGAIAGFGSALAAGDIMPGGHVPDSAFGDELLVGAPGGSSDDIGWVDWYFSTADGWMLGGSDDLGIPGDRYGAAIAAQAYPHMTLVVIAAPGNDEVVLIEATSASVGLTGTRFSLPAPSLGTSGFGETLAFGDVNNDGIPDLVVGAPDSDEVFVYKGDLSGGPIFPNPPLTISGIPGDDFGRGLAVGPVWGDFPGQNMLLTGSPNHNVSGLSNAGRVCAHLIQDHHTAASGLLRSSVLCADNNFGAADDQLGYSVAVGAFVPVDTAASLMTPWARQLEIAAGAPGHDGNRGGVFIIATDLHGPVTTDRVSFLEGPVAGARFGETLISTHLTPEASGPWEDIVVGAPLDNSAGAGAGAVHATKGGLADPSDPSAIYTALDSVSRTVRVEVSELGPLVVKALDPMTIEAQVPGSGGTPCVDNNGDDVSLVLLPDEVMQFSNWNGTTGDFDIDLGAGFLNVRILRNSPSSFQLQIAESGKAWDKLLDLNAGGCTIPNNPFALMGPGTGSNPICN